ncbi:MAG: CotH kinase family protein [Muribaculaceae bacterium]|nr:CotH kinase family protein [Muribaculaceae bacterium]
MKFKRLILALCVAAAIMPATAADLDAEGYPVMYVRGTMTDGWSARDDYRMTRTGSSYSISLPQLDGKFKVSDSDWSVNYGSKDGNLTFSDADTFEASPDGNNINANGLHDVTITFELKRGEGGGLLNTYIQISANGHEAPAVPSTDPASPLSGTLPVLYINVYSADGSTFDNEIIDRNLDHKNYFAGEYWLDLNGCKWLEDEGAASIGSADSPMPLEIKARGNYTRKAFAKKPFKLKLGKKQAMLGLSKSKHFALLAHADDSYGYLRNFTGFNLGRRIGLPWTPWQQPVEVVINGDYRGLYFLTESIRIDPDRIDITELDDLADDPAIISGGYLVELDNYDEENQISMPEKSCVDGHYLDRLRVTWDTPELYSDLQRRFITEQFTAMNDLVGANDSRLWSYIDLDDAARYYLVEEIISHTEAYHGSTYLFRDRGEGQKWHFSPLWDCGNGFNGPTDNFFYNDDPFGNTWIPSMRANKDFNDKVARTWLWFMSSCYDGLIADIDTYVAHIAEAAKADCARWKSAPQPDGDVSQPVVNNTNMQDRRRRVVEHLDRKTAWLKEQFGNYTAGTFAEPERDTTEAAPLPDYATSAVADIITDADATAEYYNLQGLPVDRPTAPGLYIERRGSKARKVLMH